MEANDLNHDHFVGVGVLINEHQRQLKKFQQWELEQNWRMFMPQVDFFFFRK